MVSGVRKFIVAAILASLITGCASNSYQAVVQKELQLDYVFVPPTAAYMPDTLFAYDEKQASEPFPVCPYYVLAGLDEAVAAALVEKNALGAGDLESNSQADVQVNLTSSDLAKIGTQYSDVSQVTFQFENGSEKTIPGILLEDFVREIENNERCINSIKIYKAEYPNARFLMAQKLISYDINYHILDKNGVDITGTIPSNVKNTIMGDIGISGTTDATMQGKQLNVGFRYTKLDTTVSQMLADGLRKLKDKRVGEEKVVYVWADFKRTDEGISLIKAANAVDVTKLVNFMILKQ